MPHLLGKGRPRYERAVWHEQDELVAPVPRQHVLRPDVPRDARHRAAKHLISRYVAPGVVDVLEAVDVEHEQRQGLGPSGRVADLGEQVAHEVLSG